MQINPHHSLSVDLLPHYRFVVIGAGPVGLLCANLLGQAGQSCLLVERLSQPVAWSRAIGISPPSLEILQGIGVAEDCVRAGSPIRRVWVHGSKGIGSRLGGVDFSKLASDFPFMLSLPQTETESILRRRLQACDSVKFVTGIELSGLCQTDDSIELSLRQADSKTPIASQPVRADYVLACDGIASTTRTLLGVPWRNRRYKASFVMGDFPQSPEITKACGDESHLFFTAGGAVESFPLPGNRRRWIVQTPEFQEQPPAQLIADTVFARTGLRLGQTEPDWQSPFGVRRDLAGSFYSKRVFLLGDAAHIMSPIGGQGMNTGFADAADLIALLLSPSLSDRQLKAWEKHRRRAFRIAAGRAERSMGLGIVRGRFASFLRNLVLWVMLHGPWQSKLRRDYAMLTIPRLARQGKNS